MIETSPRTKIILLLNEIGGLDYDNLKKIYSEKQIVINRIDRLKSTDQIICTENIIKINDNKFSLKIINYVFDFIKKFL